MTTSMLVSFISPPWFILFRITKLQLFNDIAAQLIPVHLMTNHSLNLKDCSFLLA